MKKYHYILVLILGLFLMPTTSMACGVSSTKHSCKKEVASSKSEKKSCCSNDASKEKEPKECNGNCGHAKCGCTSTCASSSVSLLFEPAYKSTIFYISSIEKDNFSPTSSPLSAGYYSIWLLPKIS
jgi:hypothetical protein